MSAQAASARPVLDLEDAHSANHTAMLGAMRRWLVLVTFTLVAGVSQLLWLNFAPILTAIQARYHVSELTASTLILVFPALYVLLSLPAGALIDRRGYRVVVGAGAIAQALFACGRIYDSSFAVMLVCQIGIAAAQPFIINGVTKLVSDWFPEGQGAIATGIATMGMFVGMAAALAATPPLVASMGLRGAMIVYAAISVATGLAFVAVARERPSAAVPVKTRFRDLLRRDLVIVFAISFLGLGFFNGLTTWLEAIVAPNGIDAVRAGVLGGVLVGGGIVGAAVIPALSDRLRRRKPFVIACTLIALLATIPLCSARSYPLLLVLGGALGFFFLPAYALLLEMSVELAGAEAAGLATGVLMLLGNAGGVVVVIAMPLVRGAAVSYRAGAFLLRCCSSARWCSPPSSARPFTGGHARWDTASSSTRRGG